MKLFIILFLVTSACGNDSIIQEQKDYHLSEPVCLSCNYKAPPPEEIDLQRSVYLKIYPDELMFYDTDLEEVNITNFTLSTVKIFSIQSNNSCFKVIEQELPVVIKVEQTYKFYVTFCHSSILTNGKLFILTTEGNFIVETFGKNF